MLTGSMRSALQSNSLWAVDWYLKDAINNDTVTSKEAKRLYLDIEYPGTSWSSSKRSTTSRGDHGSNEPSGLSALGSEVGESDLFHPSQTGCSGVVGSSCSSSGDVTMSSSNPSIRGGESAEEVVSLDCVDDAEERLLCRPLRLYFVTFHWSK